MRRKKPKPPMVEVSAIRVPAPAGNIFGTGQVPVSPTPAPDLTQRVPARPPHHDGQYTTLDTARFIASLVDAQGLGGGVLPYNPNDADWSGVFIPEYHGPFQTPTGVGPGEGFYFLRFANGKVMNAGLIAGTMAFSPRWPEMVRLELATVPEA